MRYLLRRTRTRAFGTVVEGTRPNSKFDRKRPSHPPIFGSRYPYASHHSSPINTTPSSCRTLIFAGTDTSRTNGWNWCFSELGTRFAVRAGVLRRVMVECVETRRTNDAFVHQGAPNRHIVLDNAETCSVDVVQNTVHTTDAHFAIHHSYLRRSPMHLLGLSTIAMAFFLALTWLRRERLYDARGDGGVR